MGSSLPGDDRHQHRVRMPSLHRPLLADSAGSDGLTWSEPTKMKVRNTWDKSYIGNTMGHGFELEQSAKGGEFLKMD